VPDISLIDWLLTNIRDWLPMSPLEIAATVFGLWSVVCYVRESVWAWPTGLINVLLYIVLFWHGKLYAETCLQVIYVVLQFYGWWQWARGGVQHHGVAIRRTSPRLWSLFALIAVAASLPIAFALGRWTDSTVPWWDAVPTVLSLIAQWMISKKLLENWLVWIIVDLISIPLFAYKGFYLTAGLYAVFLILCVIGLRTWHRTYRSSAVA
jgi:nicotinamide mononucleotide transporter